MWDFLQLGVFQWDEWAIIRDCIDNNGENFYGICGSLFQDVEKEIGDIVSAQIKSVNITDISREDIKWFSQQVVETVVGIIEDKFGDKFKKNFIHNEIAAQVGYRTYVYWILKKLEKAWLDIEELTGKRVNNDLAQEIYNILKDKALTTLFIVLKSTWILDKSDNPINEYEEESEIKVLDIDKKDVVSRLKEMWAKLVFEWEITDRYFDTDSLDLDSNKKVGKRSFRIRNRKHKNGGEDNYYTIKRKEKKSEEWQPRVCFEKEYLIKEFDLFENILEDFWLRNSRSKKKDRIAYSLEWTPPGKKKSEKIKVDIDTYEGIPTLLEIEAESQEATEYMIQVLWLGEHKRLNTGSRGLYEHYEMKEKYDKNYTRTDSGGIIWRS